MRGRDFDRAAALAIVGFLVLTGLIVITPGARATYGLAISGDTDFPEADPFTPTTYEGHVTVFLEDYSQGPLDIRLQPVGTLGPYITLGKDDAPLMEFTLYPAQYRRVSFRVNFPASDPGTYTGIIRAEGIEEQSVEGEMVAEVKVAIGLRIDIAVPSDVRIAEHGAFHTGGFSEADIDGWGRNWTSSMNVVNSLASDFSGRAELQLWDGEMSSMIDSFERDIDVPSGSLVHVEHTWPQTLGYGDTFNVLARVYDEEGGLTVRSQTAFRVPSPVDLGDISHVPNIVYPGTLVVYRCTALTGLGTVTLHIDNGTAVVETEMLYDAETGDYIAQRTEENAGGTAILYWATGEYQNTTSESAVEKYTVFSLGVPDLKLTSEDIILPITAVYQGDPLQVQVIVHNALDAPVSDVLVTLYDYDTPVGNTTISYMSGHSTKVVQFSYFPKEGERAIRVEIDPANAIEETDEDNNYMSKTFVVLGPRAEGASTPPEPSIWDEYGWWIIIAIIILLAAAATAAYILMKNK